MPAKLLIRAAAVHTTSDGQISAVLKLPVIS
jgi:hypothetical protein